MKISLKSLLISTVMDPTPIKINKEQQKKIFPKRSVLKGKKFHFSHVVPKQMRRQGTFGGEPNKSRRPIIETVNEYKIYIGLVQYRYQVRYENILALNEINWKTQIFTGSGSASLLMRIRILLFTVMWILIRLFTLMRIRIRNPKFLCMKKLLQCTLEWPPWCHKRDRERPRSRGSPDASSGCTSGQTATRTRDTSRASRRGAA
jgi:hypothetical protein